MWLPIPSVMASFTLRHTLLWVVSCLPIVLGLPGLALIAQKETIAHKDESFDASQQFDTIDRAEGLFARAIQITPTDASVPNYTYAGCYTDANPSSLTPQFLLSAMASTSTTSTTWTSCTTFCAGYQYAGINGGSTCRCGNSFAYTPILARDSLCSTPCTGNATQSCGGVNRLTIFRNNNYGIVLSSSLSSSASSPLAGSSSSQVPTTLVASVVTSSGRTSSVPATSSVPGTSSLSSTPLSLATSTATLRVVTTTTTSLTPAAIINPLAPLIPVSPAAVLPPLLSSQIVAILPSSIVSIPSLVVNPSPANIPSSLPSLPVAAALPLQQPSALSLAALVASVASLATSPTISTSPAPGFQFLPLQVVSSVVPAFSSILAPPIIPTAVAISSLADLVANGASLAVSSTASSSSAPALPLLPLQFVSSVVPALSSVLASPNVPTIAAVSSVGLASVISPMVPALSSVLASPIIPTLAAFSSTGLVNPGPESPVLPSLDLPASSSGGLPSIVVQTPAILLPPAPTGLANAPPAIVSVALPLVSQVLPVILSSARPAVPSLVLPALLSSSVASEVLQPSTPVPLLQLPLSSILPTLLPLSSSRLALPEIPLSLESAISTGLASLPTPTLLTDSTLVNSLQNLNFPIDIPVLSSAPLSAAPPNSLGGPSSISPPQLPIISPLGQPNVLSRLPLIPSQAIAALPSLVVPEIDSLPSLLPSIFSKPPTSTALEGPGLLDGLLPTVAGDTPLLPLPATIEPTSVGVPQLQAIPSVVLPTVPLIPSIALPQISALPEIPTFPSLPNLESPEVPSTELPPLDLPVIDIPTAVSAIATALQQLPNFVGTPLDAVSTQVPLASPVLFPPLSPPHLLPGAIEPTSLVPQAPALPSIILPEFLAVPSVAVPDLDALPESPDPSSVLSGVPPIGLPVLDLTSALAAVPTALQQLPDFVQTPLDAVPTLEPLTEPTPLPPFLQLTVVPSVQVLSLPVLDLTSALESVPTALQELPGLVETPLGGALPTLDPLAEPTSLPSLSQLTDRPLVHSPDIPTTLPVASLSNIAQLPSPLGPPVLLPSLEAVAASVVLIAQVTPLVEPLPPILEGLPVVPSPPVIVSNIVAPLVAPLSAINPATSPTSHPGVIEQGTVYDDTYTWTFFRSGVVRVDESYVVPTSSRFVGFLPDGTLVGLFVDGLHIGEHVVPYPAAYLALIIRYHLDVAPLELLDSLVQEPSH